jgi:Domain of unknown function, B. Theta Gene description (DUF3871)/AAA domain
MKLQPVKKQQIKLRLGLSGASGFGKTYSTLLLAFGITNDWTKIAVIDTENGSANLYSRLGGYNVLSLKPSFSPEHYIEALRVAKNASMEVVIIDSINHEWNGKGGCLELHEKREEVYPIGFIDSQISHIIKDYYEDKDFKVGKEDKINLWSLYNIFTGATKSSYIDSFLRRESQAYEFTQELANSLQMDTANWYLYTNIIANSDNG